MEFVKLGSKKFKVGFATNGIQLNLNIMEKLKQNKLTFLDISANMDTNKYFLVKLVVFYIQANKLGIDCRFRCVVQNSAEYIYLSYWLKDYKVRWQRLMIRSDKIRTQKCPAKDKVMVVLWDGTVVPCCGIINKEIVYGKVGEELNMEFNELENEYCRNCFEVEDDIPIRKKLG